MKQRFSFVTVFHVRKGTAWNEDRAATSERVPFFRALWLVALIIGLMLAGCGKPGKEPAGGPAVSAATVAFTPLLALTSSPDSSPVAVSVAPSATPSRPVLTTATADITTTPNSNSSLPAATPDALISDTVPVYTYKVVSTYPHDRGAFTQGLVVEDGILVEGTGLRGQSTLREVELESGQVLRAVLLPEQFFGEGVTVFRNKVYQITWQEHTGFVYDRGSFELLQQFNYATEGWGLTHDGEKLIMSDGTAMLYFLNPATLAVIGQVEVRDRDRPVMRLNELEYVEGEVYANVWQTDRIARIDPDSGQVVGWIDLTGLLGPEDRTQPVDVLNGIAYDGESGRLFVTGKWWPKLFEIELLVNEDGS